MVGAGQQHGVDLLAWGVFCDDAGLALSAFRREAEKHSILVFHTQVFLEFFESAR